MSANKLCTSINTGVSIQEDQTWATSGIVVQIFTNPTLIESVSPLYLNYTILLFKFKMQSWLQYLLDMEYNFHQYLHFYWSWKEVPYTCNSSSFHYLLKVLMLLYLLFVGVNECQWLVYTHTFPFILNQYYLMIPNLTTQVTEPRLALRQISSINYSTCMSYFFSSK